MTDAPSLKVLVFLHGHDDAPARWRAAAEAMAPPGCAVELPTGPLTTGSGASWLGSPLGDTAPETVEAALTAVDGHLEAAAARHRADPGEMALAGFSQGANVALLYTVLDRPSGVRPLAAAVAIAGWLTVIEGYTPPIEAIATGPLGAQRFLFAHGADDETVPLPFGRTVARFLQAKGYDVTMTERDVGHDPTPFAGDVRDWLGGITAG